MSSVSLHKPGQLTGTYNDLKDSQLRQHAYVFG